MLVKVSKTLFRKGLKQSAIYVLIIGSTVYVNKCSELNNEYFEKQK
jgi:hypothetical protein